MSAEVTDAHVALSLAAATEALTQLERSLRSGGFAEGAAAYQRMAEVLVAQRLFLGAEDPALSERFDHLGSTARRVFELLDPYAGAMRRLATLAPERVEPGAVEAVLEQIGRRGRRGTSSSVVSRATRLPLVQVEQALAELVAAGTVVRRTTGDLTSYRLAGTGRESTSRKAGGHA